MAKAHMAGRTARCVPYPDKPPHVNAAALRQLSGNAVAKLMHSSRTDSADEAACAPQSHRGRPQRSNFSSPTDFYAGPTKPGVVRGIRRCAGGDTDMVGKMLTDDYLMSTIEVKKPLHDPHAQVDNACNVLVAEQPYRRATKQLTSTQPLDAPFFEDNDPKPPRETPTPSGRKHYKIQSKQSIIPGAAAPAFSENGAGAAVAEVPNAARAASRYKSNRSYDILHLDRYKAEDLNEVRSTNRQHHICKVSAPEMPPPKKPAVRRVTAVAKEEHDVLGTGRFGKAEEAHPTGVAHVGTRGKNGTLNLFSPPTSKQRDEKQRKQTHEQHQQEQQKQSHAGKNAQTNSLLRYYDPTVDAPIAQPKVRAEAYRANRESHEVPEPPHRKAAGQFCEKNSQRTCELVWEE